MDSWLAPAAVWKDTTLATGIPGGYDAASRPLVNMTSPLCTGVWGATRSAVMALPGSWLLPNVTPTFDWPSVTRRTTQVWWNDWITWPTSPPAPTTGYPTSTPSARPLSSVIVAVKLDEYSSMVCAVTVGSDWRNGNRASASSSRSCRC